MVLSKSLLNFNTLKCAIFKALGPDGILSFEIIFPGNNDPSISAQVMAVVPITNLYRMIANKAMPQAITVI